MQELFPGTTEALNNLSLYKKETPVFEDVDAFELEYEHYSELKAELGYETVWSVDSGIMNLDQKIFSDKARVGDWVVAIHNEKINDQKIESFVIILHYK